MESVILLVTGAMLGGVAGLIAAALCAASGNQETQKQNARMRKAIKKTHDDLTDLSDKAIKRTGSYFFYKEIKEMQDELKNALEEG
jgi:gas vesicle protein